jgi:hypothetical protein
VLSRTSACTYGHCLNPSLAGTAHCTEWLELRFCWPSVQSFTAECAASADAAPLRGAPRLCSGTVLWQQQQQQQQQQKSPVVQQGSLAACDVLCHSFYKLVCPNTMQRYRSCCALQSADATYQPQPAMAGDVWSFTLMPWSPFPCRYDATKSYGVPDQKKIE